MRKIWEYISFLGLKDKTIGLNQRTRILCNQINAVVMVIMFVLLIFLMIMASVENDKVGIGTLRVFLLFNINIINLILARYKCHIISKLSLIFLPPVVFILLPTLIGFVEEEGFIYYPYILIALSIIPQLLLLPDKDKFIYRFAVVYYFILTMVIDRLMMYYMPEKYIIVDRISTFHPSRMSILLGLPMIWKFVHPVC